jgi:hypothetical protein
MPKTTIIATPGVDIRALARVGAQLQLQQLLDEQARIVAAFPELRKPQPEPRVALRVALPPADEHTHSCATCGDGFTPDSRHQNQKTCGRAACVKAYKREYMRAYFAKRAAQRNGAAS